MNLEADDIAEIRAGWSRMARSRDRAAGLFYGRLFQLSPQSQALFAGDMAAQGRKLIAMLDHVVAHLDAPARLAPEVEELARRHVAFGVRAGDYADVGQALIWMLERAQGEDFSTAQRHAWGRAYAGLSQVMIAAAYPDLRTRLPAADG